MGKNKLAKFAEMQTFRNVIQPPVQGHILKDHPLKGKWKEVFFGNKLPLVLELGCGKGEYTTGLARMYPGKNFVGIDIKGARMWTGAREAILEGLGNVAFLRTKIEFLENFFGENEVEEIWITFPDPQMTKPGKRLTSTGFLKKYRMILVKGGTIHLKTDSNFLFSYTLALAKQNGLPLLACTGNLYESSLLNELLTIRTFYEKQWIDRGIEIKYISFELGDNSDFSEPEGEFERDSYRSFGRSARNH